MECLGQLLEWGTIRPLNSVAEQRFEPRSALGFLQRLEATDFDEKKEINKRKQMILEGKVRLSPPLQMHFIKCNQNLG